MFFWSKLVEIGQNWSKKQAVPKRPYWFGLWQALVAETKQAPGPGAPVAWETNDGRAFSGVRPFVSFILEHIIHYTALTIKQVEYSNLMYFSQITEVLGTEAFGRSASWSTREIGA